MLTFSFSFWFDRLYLLIIKKEVKDDKLLEYVKEKAEVSLTCLNTWQHTTNYSYIYSQNSSLALLHDTENSALLRTVMGS